MLPIEIYAHWQRRRRVVAASVGGRALQAELTGGRPDVGSFDNLGKACPAPGGWAGYADGFPGSRATSVPCDVEAPGHQLVPERHPGSDGPMAAVTVLHKGPSALMVGASPHLALARGLAGQSPAGLPAVLTGGDLPAPEKSKECPIISGSP
jgi:hypothetical protein